MKKIILLLSLNIILTTAFCQNNILQENFEKGTLNDAWKITRGKWYVVSLEEKGIKPPSGDNDFALASAGNSEIILNIPVENIDPETLQELSFTYWVHSRGSKGTVSVVFLNARKESLSSVHFEELRAKGEWDTFNQKFKVPKETSVILLKLGEKAGREKNTVYFKNFAVVAPAEKDDVNVRMRECAGVQMCGCAECKSTVQCAFLTK